MVIKLWANPSKNHIFGLYGKAPTEYRANHANIQ